MTNLLQTLYKFMLWLYPRHFYTMFGPEMADVFAQKLRQAQSNRAILMAFGRELYTWPGSCLREHWAAQQAGLNFPVYKKLSWGETAVAALPYLLMALLFGAIHLVAELIFGSSPGSAAYNIATAAALGAFIIILAAAWWQSWPAWSASWLGHVIFLLLYVFLPQLILQEQFAWNTPSHLLQAIISVVIPPLLIFGAFYWLVGRWPSAGAVILLLPLGFSWVLRSGSFPESLPFWVSVFVWCWLAIVSVLMVRWGNGRWYGWLLGLAAVVVNLISLYASQFWAAIPLQDFVTQFIEMLLTGFVLTLLPLMAILLFHTLRRRLVRDGRARLRQYRFLFGGIVGIIVAGQAGQLLSWPYEMPLLEAGMGVMVTAVFLLSIVGLILGATGLQQHKPGWLLLLLVLFPFIYQAETLSILLSTLINWDSFNQFILQEMMQLFSLVAGVVWLGLAVRQLARTAPPLSEEPVDQVEQYLTS